MRRIRKKGLEKIYEERRKGVGIVYQMENNGLNYLVENAEELRKEYSLKSDSCEKVCKNIAKSYGYDLTVPKGGRNNSLDEFLFTDKGPNLEPVSLTKAKKPSLNKEAIDEYRLTLEPRSREKMFFVLKRKPLWSMNLFQVHSFSHWPLEVLLSVRISRPRQLWGIDSRACQEVLCHHFQGSV